jgi:hypothetical protein
MKTVVEGKSKREETIDEFLDECEACCLRVRETLLKIKKMDGLSEKKRARGKVSLKK